MLRGLARSPFAPRAPQALGPNAAVAEPPPPPVTPVDSGPRMQVPANTPVVPAPPVPPRRSEAAKEIDPAQAQYESLKHLIHTRIEKRSRH